MGNMKSIEKAIEAMPPAELAEFRRWFAEVNGSGSAHPPSTTNLWVEKGSALNGVL